MKNSQNLLLKDRGTTRWKSERPSDEPADVSWIMVDGEDDLRVLREGALFQIVFHPLHEDPALVNERPDQLVAHFFIFPIVTPLSEIKCLVYSATHFFREYSWFHKPPVKVTENPAVLGRRVRLEDKQGENCVKHGIIRSIDH